LRLILDMASGFSCFPAPIVEESGYAAFAKNATFLKGAGCWGDNDGSDCADRAHQSLLHALSMYRCG
jgi:hypothetical protein